MTASSAPARRRPGSTAPSGAAELSALDSDPDEQGPEGGPRGAGPDDHGTDGRDPGCPDGDSRNADLHRCVPVDVDGATPNDAPADHADVGDASNDAPELDADVRQRDGTAAFTPGVVMRVGFGTVLGLDPAAVAPDRLAPVHRTGVLPGAVPLLITAAVRAMSGARARPPDEHPAVSVRESHRRFPSAPLREWVRARDGPCRGAGCTRSAVGADMDLGLRLRELPQDPIDEGSGKPPEHDDEPDF